MMQSARFIVLTTDQISKLRRQAEVPNHGADSSFFVIRGHAAEMYLAAFQPLTLHIHINQQKV